MNTVPRSIRLQGLGIAATAGFVDACGYLVLGGYFLSFMSGNSTRLAVATAHVVAHAWMPLAIIVCFVGGVVIGDLWGSFSRRRGRRVLALVAGLLAAAALIGSASATSGALLAAGAMGASNSVLSVVYELPVGLTYMTGTLVNIGRQLAAKIRGEPVVLLPYVLHWGALLVGGVLGAVVEMRFGLQALWLAVGFVCLLASIAPLQHSPGTVEQDNRV